MTLRAIARPVARALVAISVLALVVIFAIMAVPAVIGAEHSYVVLTNSMAPEISPGDAVVVGEVDPAAVREGDVITFQREADRPPVTHRVETVIRDDGGIRFRTAGDNNEGIDPWTVGADALVGKVWFSIPLIGHVVQFGNSTAGTAVLVGVPIALLILSELWARSGDVSVTATDPAPVEERPEAPDERVIPRFEDGSEQSADGGGLRLSVSELRLGALGFGTFALYAIYVAVRTTNGATVGVAVGATIAAAFHVGGLTLLALAGRDASAATDDPDRSREIRDGHGGGADD